MGAGGVHGGHRERMRSKYVRGGLEVLADHEVLELLLYYPIRRRNVNQKAHELLGGEGVREIGRLGESGLKNKSGIGEKTALFMSLAGAAAERYASVRVEKGIKLGTYGASSSVAKRLLGGAREEKLVMLSLNAQCRLQGITTLARGRIDEESIDGQQVAEAAMRYQAHSVILANNHMGGELKPREGEIRATQKVANVLGGIDIRLWDQILVRGEETLGLNKSGYLSGIEEPEGGGGPEMLAADSGKYKKDKNEGNNKSKERLEIYNPYEEERSYE